MNRKPNKVVIKKSSNSGKKLMAIFSYPETTRTRTIHFGSAGMDDYTKTKDKAQKQRYLERHRRRENWSKPDTAGALSRWVLWNKETRSASIADYKRRFDFK